MSTRHGLLFLLGLAVLLVSPNPAEAQLYGPPATWEFPYCSDGSYYDPWFGCANYWSGSGGFMNGRGCWCGPVTCSCGAGSQFGFGFNCSFAQRRPYFMRERRWPGSWHIEGLLARQREAPPRPAIIAGRDKGWGSEARAGSSRGGDRASGSRGGGREGSRGQSGSRGSSGADGRQSGGHQGGGHGGGGSGGGAAPHRPR